VEETEEIRVWEICWRREG